MTNQLLSAVAAAGFAALLLPHGEAQAQNRAAAEAAIERMGFARDGDSVSYARADWSRGRYILSDVVIRDLDVKGEDTDIDGPEEMRVERLIFDAPRLDTAGDVMFDGVALEGVSASDADGEGMMRIARISVDEPNAAFVRDLVRVFSGEDGDFDPDWSDYRFASAGFEGFSVTGEDEGGPFDIAIEQFVMQDYSDIELGRIALMGLRVDGSSQSGPVTVRLDEFSLTGFQSGAYSDLMDTIAAGGDENAVMSAYYGSLTPQVDVFDRFAMRGFLADAEGVHLALDNMTARIEQSGSRYITQMSLDSMRLIPDAAKESGAQLAMGLGMLGYEQLEVRMQSHGIYDEATGRAWTEGENFIELTDGLRIEMNQDVGGYNEYFEALPEFAASMEAGAGEEAQADAALKLMAPIVLHNISLRLVDMSLLDRALDAGAAAQGVTREELRIQTGAMAAMGLMAAPPEVPRPMLAQLSTALTEFINRGGSLTIDMSPPEPISVGTIVEQVEAGTFDYNALGLSFTAEGP
ncbi:hypothetical protein [Maricaulis sp.]|uniref:hypothetical protein n=1 Tax=Maricaulis sp. TaxID=1486257 RepID=UPI002630F21D|nr:hypothetical protein [Maricaulis sp.]